MGVVAMTVLMLIGFLMMFIILLQRGRGGGLAGAFGGAGGQSALGTRAGDVFTRITIVLAVVWVLLAAGSGPLLRSMSTEYTDPTPDKPEVSSGKGKGDATIPPPEGDAGGLKKDDSKKTSTVPEGTNPFAEKEPEKSDTPETKKPDAENPESEKDKTEKSDAEKPAEKKEKESEKAPEKKDE